MKDWEQKYVLGKREEKWIYRWDLTNKKKVASDACDDACMRFWRGICASDACDDACDLDKKIKNHNLKIICQW